MKPRPPEWIAWLAVLAAVTAGLIALRSSINEAHVALAYLLVVQGASARGGRRLGVTLALLAFACFDVFFLPPFGRLSIQDPLNWVVLVAFLGISLLSAELLYRARAERANALEAAHRAKDDVLAAVSHDLRTPLTTIKGLAHEIAQSGDDRAETIEEEADRLHALVGQLLDLSRLTSGATIVNPQPNEAEGGARVEEHHQDHPLRHVRQVHRLLLALVEERGELVLADHRGELVVGGEVRGGQRGESDGVELRLLPHRRDELSRAVHEECAARPRVVEEALEQPLDPPEVLFLERPAGSTRQQPASTGSVRAARDSSMRASSAAARRRRSGRASHEMKSRRRRMVSTEAGRPPRYPSAARRRSGCGLNRSRWWRLIWSRTRSAPSAAAAATARMVKPVVRRICLVSIRPVLLCLEERR